ncbi:MAG TPA: hypothetical protein VKE51_19290 [Vicinamibacterales bacterium]|nr:hypothetical protein [Vicinamibacterales bacterium]
MVNRHRAFVTGMIAADPHQGGATWAVLQYVLGLRNLGYDVFLVEPIPPSSLRPAGTSLTASINAGYFRDVAARFGLTSRAALLRQDTRETVGLPYDDLRRAATGSVVLINISGMLTDPALFAAIPCRVYLDLDPAFNQLWHTLEGIDVRFDGHTHFVTVGCLIGCAACDVPTCGRIWLPTVQPVVLPEWPHTPGNPDAAWTTVCNWRGYGSIQAGGVQYGQKVHSFRRLIELPQRAAARFQPAVAIHPAEVNDLAALDAHGWDLVDPAAVADTPDRYRAFIQRSKGELGIAKSGYVESRCGWFSDRSVCYLASGRPVVAQDTGFGDYLPTGEGLFAFSTVDDAVSAIDMVNVDYLRHCRRAREIAEVHFRAERVLGSLLERIGAADDTSGQHTWLADASVGAPASPREPAG